MSITIRSFVDDDAETVFKLRAEAFVLKFLGELGAERCVAGINAYMPSDYLRMAKEMQFFIAEAASVPVGFYAVRLDDETTAELLFLYVSAKCHRQGVGSKLIRHSEDWIRENWPGVTDYVVDTGIPKYNGDFYRRMGFIDSGDSACPFPDMPIPALRLSKKLY